MDARAKESDKGGATPVSSSEPSSHGHRRASEGRVGPPSGDERSDQSFDLGFGNRIRDFRRRRLAFLRGTRDQDSWSLERLLAPIIMAVVVAVAFTSLLILGSVQNQSETVGRVNTTTEVGVCRSRFANEREAVRADLEVASANMSAGLAEGLALVVDENADPDDIDAIRLNLPVFVADVRSSADELIEAVDAYDRVLELPEDEFLAECRKRFP